MSWYSGPTFGASVGSGTAGCGGLGESFLREKQSGTTCSFPGMYVGVKEYIRDLTLLLISLGLGMVMISCEPNIPMRGLWSKARMKLTKPRRKNLHFSILHIAAADSPSIGANRLSAGLQNLLPQKLVCHPVVQQPGLTLSHSQCFWQSQTILDQSDTRAVGRLGSKFLTPSIHCRIISLLEASNDLSRSGDHWKGALVDKRCLNGAISGAVVKV